MSTRGMIRNWLVLALSIGIFWATSDPMPANEVTLARVVVDGACVRSGPGDAYYETEHLERGVQVEIYHQTDEGWCAIRPPADSFSWVAAKYVQPSEEPGLGTILQDGTPARIGSRLGPYRHAVQIRLTAGELIEILDQEQIGDHTWYRIAPPRGEFRWIAERDLEWPARSAPADPVPADPVPARSAPAESAPAIDPAVPSGEADTWHQLDKPSQTEPEILPAREPHSLSPPVDNSRDKASSVWKSAQQETKDKGSVPEASRLQPAASDGNRGPWADRQPEDPVVIRETGRSLTTRKLSPTAPKDPAKSLAIFEPGNLAASNPSERWRPVGKPAWRDPSSDMAAPRRTDATENIVYSKRPATRAAVAQPHVQEATHPFADSFEAIDYELSRIIANDPRTWRFDRVRHRTTVLLNSAQTASDTADAESLLAKISRFEEIQHRRASLTNRIRTVDRPRANQSLSGGPADSGSSTLSEDGSMAPESFGSEDMVWLPEKEGSRDSSAVERYDVVGILKRVGSRRRDAPRFALVDATGDIVSFITPSPGVNLQPFVGQRVGVYGTRGYMPEFRRAHVVAARVTPLDTRQ